MRDAKGMLLNHRILTVFMVSFFMILFSGEMAFAQDPASVFPELVISKQPAAISVAGKDEPVTIAFEAVKGEEDVSYQWFRSADGSTENAEAIEGANESSFSTGTFTEKGIRYYFCVATAGEESVTSDVAAVAYTGLPVLYINTDDPMTEITKDAYVFGDMKLVYEDGKNFEYEFKKEKNGEKREGIKGHGHSTWNMDKKGYAIKFDEKQSLFDLGAAKEWCILANYADKTLLRNVYASLLAKDIFNAKWNPTSYPVEWNSSSFYPAVWNSSSHPAEWNPSFHPVEVVWDSVYQGNYILCEMNTIGAGRVNVQDISDYSEENIEREKFVDQNEDSEVDLYDGGFILEIDKWKDATYWFETEKTKAPVAMKDPDEASEDIQEHVKTLVQTAENALYSENFKDPVDGWWKYFDEESVVDWFLVNEIARNHDAKEFSSIYKFYDPADSELHYGPIWDFDVGFGNDGDGEVAAVTGWYVKNGFWTTRMFEDPEFVRMVITRWNEKKEALIASVEDALYLPSDDSSPNKDSLASNNSVSAECNFIKWDVLGKKVYKDSAGYEERLTYASEVEYMKAWLEERIAWIDKALNNSFLIEYDLDGGTLSTANPGVFLSEDTEPFYLNSPVKEGYVFAGWSGTGIDGTSKTVQVTDDELGDRTYKAHWKPDIFYYNAELSKREFIYSGAAITPDMTVKLGDDTLTPKTDYVVSYDDNVNAGDVTVTITGVGDYGGILETTFKIKQAPLTVTANDQTCVYNGKEQGGVDPAYEDEETIKKKVTVEGLQGSDALTSVTLTGSAKDFGEYSDRIEITGLSIGEATDNYDITYVKGKLTIEKAKLTITAKDKTLVYNGETQGEGNTSYENATAIDDRVTVESLKGDDVLTSIGISSQGKGAGEYPIIPSNAAIGQNGKDTGNYDITYVNGKLKIKKAPLNITVNGDSAKKVFTGKKQSFKGTVTATSSDEAFDASKFSYTGSTKVSGTKKGKYTTALSRDKCVYDDKNYAVKWTIGNPVRLTITPSPKAKTNGTLLAEMTAKGSSGFEFTWTRVKGAKGYDIFFGRCGDKPPKKVKTIKGNKTFKWTKKGLEKHMAYKAYVRAWVMKDGKKTYVKSSLKVHAYTSGGTKNHTNVKSVTVKKRKLSLEAKETYEIKAKVNGLQEGKNLTPSTHAPKLRYASSNKKIATVSKSGKITARAKGSCKIYVIAASGTRKTIKLTVR